MPAEAFPLATPQPPKRDLHWVFVGAEGLRAGWGVLLFVLLFIGFSFLSIQVFKHLLPPSHHSAVFPLRLAFISEGAQLVPLLLATAIMALIERRPLLAYGYQGTGKAVRFLSGLVWGFVALSALVLVLWKAGLLAFDGVQLHGTAIWKYALGWASDSGGVRCCFRSSLGFPTAPTPARRRVGTIRGGSRWPGLLPQPLVYGIALVGPRLPRQLGLGGVVLLRDFRQRPEGRRPPVWGTPDGGSLVERRSRCCEY